jgi:telomere length regulation protein
MVSVILRTLVDEDQVELFSRMLSRLKSFEQRKYMNAAMTFVERQYFESSINTKADAPIQPSPTISGAACLLESMVKDSELLKEHIVSLLIRPSIPTLDDSLALRRSVIAVLARDEGWSNDHAHWAELTNGR